ncbi:MAG: tail fiber domain-containing protein [Ruminococcus sp.]|nr:tail fiber domain-containing protein [Ruminococcus sp.]
MINVSNAFREKLEAGEPVRMVVDITFPDGTKKTINEDIMNGDNGFSDCAESSSFPVGATICKTLTLSINNDQEQWKSYNFYGAKIHAYLKLQTSYAAPESVSTLLDESYTPILDSTGDPIIATQAATKDIIETIDKGVYTVTTPEQYSDIINVTALDDMYKANKTYTSGLKLPQSLINLVRDACKTVGIGINLTMDHGDIIIRKIPDSMTFRQLFGYAAMVESANARIDYSGNLQFVKWDFERTNIPELKDYGSPPTLSSDDIVITGIKVANGQSNDDTDTNYSGMYGEEGYVLELENELIDTDQLQTVANIIGEQIVGARFRNLEGDLVYNPLVEFGDMVYTYDRLGNKYLTPLTDVSGNVGGLTTVKTQADDPIRGSSDFYGNSTKAIVAARQMVKKETSVREEAIRRLAEALNSSSGLYMTQEPQQDGSIIYYMHNKATISESNIIWKLTAEAFAVSIDGGKTYPYGFAVTGELITRLLYAEGINADYINTGTIIVRDKSENVIFEADMDTGSVTLDGSCVTIGGKPLNKKIEDVENMAALARNMTMQLDNDYQGIPVDSNGNYTEFPECTTTATVMYGTQDITDNCTYTITTSQNIQGNWNKETKTYTVTGLTADSGWVNIKAAYLNNLAVSKQFSIAKQYAGPQGIPGVGTDGKTTYLHIQYAPVQNPTAAQMSKTPNKYIGTYTDFSGVDSADPSKYTWAKFEGDQGAQGPKGADGKSSYTWMKYATRPDGLDMSDNPDYVPLLDSAGSPILDSAGEQIYTVTQATYIGIAANKDTATESTNPADYTWSRFRGVDGYDGKDGANGIPGKDGKDGKTQYTHLAYANSADGTKDFSVSDGNREYIGMYVDFVEADSTDPAKYTWSLIKGANGAQGVPGTPGANGKTPYFHIAYANSADGRTGFSVDDSVNKLYIGQYTDYTPDDSTDPTKYSWTKIKGEQGTAGRTYFFQSNADVLLMGADKKITPAPLIVDSFYRDGNGEVAQSQKGWWKLEKSTDNGATWSALTVSQTAALDRLSINVNSLSLNAHDMLKVSLYFDQSKTKLADYQTYPVAVDVASLTQEQIVDILSDGGKFKGLYYGKNESGNTTLYISFNAAKGGTLALGGQNDGNGLVKIYDSTGSLILIIGRNGIETGATTLSDKSAKGKIAFNKKGLTFTEDTVTDDALPLEKSIIFFDLLSNIIGNFDKLTVSKNATMEGKLLFYDYENQAKRASGSSEAVTRQPIASVTANTNRVAFLSSDYHANGYGAGTEHGSHRLGVKAQWGGSSYEMHYIYTNLNISDVRLKENVKNSETDALETVNHMKVRQFDWKERMGGWHQDIGFVADELEEIDPNLALGGGYDENGEMDIKQINSPYLLNYAIKAIQELSTKVDEQEKRIKELERRLQ